MQYTKRRNLNRGYMKLEVWQRGIELFEMAFRLAEPISDFKLKSQFADAALSVSANVAEGYGRRTLPEYLQFLYTAKGSLAEVLIRAIGLCSVNLIPGAAFEDFDKLHYEVENKLLHLIAALEPKRGTDEWQTSVPTHPSIH
jgi:four helix bundle protein